jgi:hypothetical protein
MSFLEDRRPFVGSRVTLRPAACFQSGMGILLLLAAMATPALQSEMQAVEAGRNAAIRAGDMAALERLYAPDFRGIAAGGAASTGPPCSPSSAAMRAVPSSPRARF